jgi:hypothetical protein
MQPYNKELRLMKLKHGLWTAAVAFPLLIAGAGPSAADMDVDFGLGVGHPYYGSPYYYDRYYGDPFWGPRYGFGGPYYGLGAYDDDVAVGATIVPEEDDDEMVIEPAAAEPGAPCVKTNVKNFKNACPQ